MRHNGRDHAATKSEARVQLSIAAAAESQRGVLAVTRACGLLQFLTHLVVGVRPVQANRAGLQSRVGGEDVMPIQSAIIPIHIVRLLTNGLALILCVSVSIAFCRQEERRLWFDVLCHPEAPFCSCCWPLVHLGGFPFRMFNSEF